MDPLVKSIAEAAPSQVELLGSSKSFLKQSSDKLAGVEGLQIFHIFTDADVLYRNAELFLNADDHAAFGRAVELGQNNAADVGRLLENARLLKTILAGGRVEEAESSLLEALRIDPGFAAAAAALSQLEHQRVADSPRSS